jgi:acetyl esterase/lipase
MNRARENMPRLLLASGLALLLALPMLVAQQAREKPKPDVQNAEYGPHERNVLDLWKAKTEQPAPLVVFIHGGGFRAGSKEQLNADLLDRCLKAGISVAAINYRLTTTDPFPAAYFDSARAIQFLRLKAKEWNLDPRRVAATGGSAGAGTSLWIGFHEDLADPKSDDPIARQSTRLTCMAVQGAQSTYDPREIKKLIGGRAHEHPALLPFFGITADEIDTPKAHKLYEAASPINYVTKDDPPVFLFYNEPKGPLPENARPGQGIHHPNFGTYLKEKLDPLGVECVVRHQDDYRGKNVQAELHREMVEFFQKCFGGKKQE